MDDDALMDIDYEDVCAPQSDQPNQPSERVVELDRDQATPLESSPDPNTLVQNKVHISGLDAYTEENLRSYVAEHYSTAPFKRIEWINDTCANLIFGSESLAQEALIALSSVPIADVTAIPAGEAIDAKPFSSKPEAPLRVRFAMLSDKKVRGAAAHSRFYLFHPEYDPEERRRRKYREREEYGRRHNGYRRNSPEPEVYYASMYDDGEEALARQSSPANSDPRGRRSRSSSRERRQRNQDKELFDRRDNRDRELFLSRSSGRAGKSKRSQSPPVRDRDGDEAMGGGRRGHDTSKGASRNKVKGREILEKQKELFPQKLGIARKSQLDQTEEFAQRLSQDDIALQPAGLSIKGRAAQSVAATEEISIKGRASKSAKELFPDKFGDNSGRELFADRLEGRGKPRRKAVDSFS